MQCERKRRHGSRLDRLDRLQHDRSHRARPRALRGRGAHREPQRRRSSPSRRAGSAPSLPSSPTRAGYATLKNALAGTGIGPRPGPEARDRGGARGRPTGSMAAIVGAAGLAPTLAAVRRGAHRRARQQGGAGLRRRLFMAEVARGRRDAAAGRQRAQRDLPGLRPSRRDAIEKIILTASGGPFRERSSTTMRRVRPSRRSPIPNWRMGAKISVDSATMMNKGLEVIEAHHLFRLRTSRSTSSSIRNRSSTGWSSIKDGSVLAQLGSPDMRTPIAYTLGWPDRMATPSSGSTSRRSAADLRGARRRALSGAPAGPRLLAAGRGAPTILNAANETAVRAFLERGSASSTSPAWSNETLDMLPHREVESLDDVHASTGRRGRSRPGSSAPRAHAAAI